MYIYAYVAKVTVPANILVWESLRGLRTKKKKKQTNQQTKPNKTFPLDWVDTGCFHSSQSENHPVKSWLCHTVRALSGYKAIVDETFSPRKSLQVTAVLFFLKRVSFIKIV